MSVEAFRRHEIGSGRGPCRACVPVIVMPPHHALRHACGASSIEEQQIVAAARNPQGGTITVLSQSLVGQGPIEDYVRIITHLNKALHLWQAGLQRLNLGRKFPGIEHRFRIGVVKDVVKLFVDVTVIDVDVHEATLKAGRQHFHVGRMIAAVEANLTIGR